MGNTTTKEEPDLESIANSSPKKNIQALKVLRGQGYIIILPDAVRRTRRAFEVHREMEARKYARYMSDPASYNHQ